jgi:hypothetical protein
MGALIVYQVSAENGSHTDLVEIPIQLSQ